jgi:hypothetical protein
MKKMTNSGRQCAMEHCENRLGERARDSTIFCANCRQSLGFWTKTTLAHALSRRDKLRLYSERVGHVLTRRSRK